MVWATDDDNNDDRDNSDPRSNNVAKGIPALLISAKTQVYEGPSIPACRRYEHWYSGPPHKDAFDFMNFLEEATPYRQDTLLGAFCSTMRDTMPKPTNRNRLDNPIRELQELAEHEEVGIVELLYCATENLVWINSRARKIEFESCK